MSENEHETTDLEDTKPRPPSGLREAIAAQGVTIEEPPGGSLDDTAEMLAVQSGTRARPLLLALVFVSMSCICLMLAGLAGVAGYRDGIATNAVWRTATMATEIAKQYDLGVQNLAQGYPGLAADRFAWIETVQPAPEYRRDSATQLALAQTMSAQTATAAAAVTPTSLSPAITETPQPTATPEITHTVEVVPTATSENNPDYLYDRARMAYATADYEETIDWLESLIAIAPDYRPAEVTAMYMDTLTTLGTIYIRGQNKDGEDRLARGILLIKQAAALGPIEPAALEYEADVAERYLNARNYVNGGNYAAAMPILELLCAEATSTCDWGYQGVSVRDLLQRAQAGASQTP